MRKKRPCQRALRCSLVTNHNKTRGLACLCNVVNRRGDGGRGDQTDTPLNRVKTEWTKGGEGDKKKEENVVGVASAAAADETKTSSRGGDGGGDGGGGGGWLDDLVAPLAYHQLLIESFCGIDTAPLWRTSCTRDLPVPVHEFSRRRFSYCNLSFLFPSLSAFNHCTPRRNQSWMGATKDSTTTTSHCTAEVVCHKPSSAIDLHNL